MLRWLRDRFAARPVPPTPEPLSCLLVLLLAAPRPFGEDEIRAILEREHPGRFLPRNDDNFVAGNPAAPFVIMKSSIAGQSGLFFASWGDTPYVDPRRLDHHAAISIWRLTDGADHVGHYRFMGRLLAALAPEDTLGLYHEPSEVTWRWGPTIAAALRSDDVLSALGIPGRGG